MDWVKALDLRDSVRRILKLYDENGSSVNYDITYLEQPVYNENNVVIRLGIRIPDRGAAGDVTIVLWTTKDGTFTGKGMVAYTDIKGVELRLDLSAVPDLEDIL